MARTTRKDIQDSLESLKKLTGLNLALDYNSYYGGYMIQKITNNSGSYVPFGTSTRKSANIMCNYIGGMVRGYLLALEAIEK